MPVKEGGLRGSLRNVSTDVGIPDSAIIQFDATQEAFADGDSVSTLTDQLGNNDITGNATYVTNVQNGNAVYRFDGTDDGFEGAVSTLTQPLTIIAVVVNAAQIDGNNNTDREMIVTNDVGGGNSDEAALYWEGNDNHNWRLASNRPSQFSNLDGTDEPAPIVLSGVYDSTNSLLRENGSTVATGDTGEFDWGGSLTVGLRNDGISNFLNGDIGEIVFYDSNLNSTDKLSDEEERFANKWGPTLA